MELYPVALDTGMKPEEFWNYSLKEIVDLLESHARREEARLKWEIHKSFLLADLTGERFGADGKKELSRPWDWFPALFEEENRKRQQDQFEQEKLRRREYFEGINRKRRQASAGKQVP